MPASAARATPAHHRSMPGPGVRTAADCGYSAVHAAEPAPLRVRKPDHITRPPRTSSQKPIRFSRGQAISARPDLQRHEVHAQRERGRRDEEVDHRRAVHREELVVAAARGDLHPRLGQLGAHEQREHAAGQEEPEGGAAQAQGDALVVRADRQPDEAADRRERRRDRRAHARPPALPRPGSRSAPDPWRRRRRPCRSASGRSTARSGRRRPTVPAGKRRSKRAVLRGQASRLKRRSGIQKAWTTSRVRSATSTVVPAGTCRVAGRPGAERSTTPGRDG